jgi:hypothetical protein
MTWHDSISFRNPCGLFSPGLNARPLTPVCGWRVHRCRSGVSGLDPETIRDFFIGFLDGSIPDNPRDDLSLGLMLKLAADDLKTYYFEAVTAQPGESAPSSEVLAD